LDFNLSKDETIISIQLINSDAHADDSFITDKT